MAYAAVISLKQTIHRLLNSSQFRILDSDRQILQSAYAEATSLQEVLQKFDDGKFRSSRRLDAADGEIRDAVREFEDFLDLSHVPVDLVPLQSQPETFPQIFSLNLEGGDRISSFAGAAKTMKSDYIEELDNALFHEEEEDDNDVSIDFGHVEMVGFSNELAQLKRHVLNYTRPRDFVVFSILGKAGSGRSILAKDIYEKLCEEKYFDCGAWVSVGPEYDLEEILLTILLHVDDGGNSFAAEQTFGECVHACLKGRRYLIVLDDVWDTRLWDLLRGAFPEQNNGSAVLLTTGIEEVASSANSDYIHKMCVYGEEVGWHTIQAHCMDDCELVISPEMEEAGRKIARNCGGHYFPIIRVSYLMAAAEKTAEYWKKLAADEQNPVFMVGEEISKTGEIAEDLMIEFYSEENIDSSNIIGFLDREAMESKLFPKLILGEMETIAVLGMAGIGKTALVEKIFKDPFVLCHFDHRVWVTLGIKYQPEEILVDILAQIYPNEERSHIREDPTLLESLCGRLSSKRCLIVMDDIWTSDPLHYLQKTLCEVNGKVLLTTRLTKLDGYGEYDIVQHVCLLSKKESWTLFCQKVFENGSCPPNLEEAGQRISEDCEGLPLLILTVADILSREEKTPEYWNKVAEEQSSVFMEAYHKLSRVLLPSYQSLPQQLKPCFLYMGVFPQKYEISTNKLINYWIVEGLLEQNESENVQKFAAKCLLEIADKSVILVLQKGSTLGIKTSALHCVFWYLSNSEAEKNKFFLAMRKHSDCVVEDRKRQRRLCIRNNVLFAIEDVHASLASFSAARSLLCTGPRHPYPVPICFGLRLLRVLSAITIRFYEFPVEVVKLIHLRYLSLICSTEVSASISKLQNLQFFIVDRHMSIKSSDSTSYMPMAIWDMKELNHLQITGSDLPDPEQRMFLENLSTLLDVSAHSCTEKVLNGIPYLKRLRIQIELGPDGNGTPFHYLNNISNLARLKSLKCIIVDPLFGAKAVIPPAPVSMFPSSLEKLTLSGLGYPWEYMSMIGELVNLKVLKLQCYAFRGGVWESKEDEFKKLQYLSIEDSDLVCWRKSMDSFQELIRLSIKHCYKLHQLPGYFINMFEMIEVVNSNPLVETWAEGIIERGGLSKEFRLQVHSLLDPANLQK